MSALEKLMESPNLSVYKEVKDNSIYIKIGLAGWSEKKTEMLGNIVSVPIINPDIEDAVLSILVWAAESSLRSCDIKIEDNG